MSEAMTGAISGLGVSDEFDPLERAVLAYTDGIVGERGRVGGANLRSFEVLQHYLSDEQILDLTYIAAMYAMHASVSRALKLEYDDTDEQVCEVAALSEAQSRDIGADISGSPNLVALLGVGDLTQNMHDDCFFFATDLDV